MQAPFYCAALWQHPERNPLLPYAGSGGQLPPISPLIVAGAPQEEEPSATIPIARLILAGICPECGQPSLCPKCGRCHYCEDVDLPCPLLPLLGGGQCQ